MAKKKKGRAYRERTMRSKWYAENRENHSDFLTPVTGNAPASMREKKQLKQSERIHTLVESAIMIALATVLSLVKIYEAPYGGSVTLLSMAPIIVLSLRRGVGVGLAGGFVFSVLQWILGLSNVAWVPSLEGKVLCVLLDYIIPFTALGLGGMFRKTAFTKNKRSNLIVAALLGTLIVTIFRYLCHIVSGVVVWYALDLEWYADDPEHIVNRYGPFLFSAIYNGSFMLPEIIETCVGVPILATVLRKVGIIRTDR